MDELTSVRVLEQPRTRTGFQVVDLTEENDVATMRMATQPSTSGRGEGSNEESESSGNASLLDEPIQAHQRGSSLPVGINGILVYRISDMEIVDWVGGRPVYMVDHFTMTVTPEYLESLREEFQIPGDIELVVSGPNDLPFRLPPGHVTLLAEFF